MTSSLNFFHVLGIFMSLLLSILVIWSQIDKTETCFQKIDKRILAVLHVGFPLFFVILYISREYSSPPEHMKEFMLETMKFKMYIVSFLEAYMITEIAICVVLFVWWYFKIASTEPNSTNFYGNGYYDYRIDPKIWRGGDSNRHHK